jgi:glycine cleavage system H protein
MMSNLPSDLKYASSHEWAKLESDNIVRVGITDFAQNELGDLMFIELPEVGRRVHAQEQCAIVESVKSASDLYSPVTGEIVAVNQNLESEPELVNEDAFGTWLFCVQAENSAELENLMDAVDYQAMIE